MAAPRDIALTGRTVPGGGSGSTQIGQSHSGAFHSTASHLSLVWGHVAAWKKFWSCPSTSEPRLLF